MATNLAEAQKLLKAAKPRENFMQVQIDGSFILPHKAAVALLDAIGQAEKGPTYQNSHRITALDRYAVQSNVMSWQDYDRYKMAALMNVRYDDIVAAEDAALNQPQATP